jgi:acyl-CoA-binding protein
MSVEADYKNALAYVKSLPPVSDKFTLNNEDKLLFYALFKQIADGPCKTPAPSRLKVIEYYKHSAWKGLGSISKEEAMKKYIAEIDKRNPKWRDEAKL